MRTLHALSPSLATALREKLLRLERSGQYEKGLEEISQEWSRPDFLPDVSLLSEADAAETLLRFAALLGFHGHNRQIAASQERSKDLLTGLYERFLDLGDRRKAWECRNYLALAYWRTGELNEALVWVDTTLAEIGDEVDHNRLYAHVIRSLLLLQKKKYNDNIIESQSLAPMFFRFGDPFLAGSFCTNIGLSLKNAGRTAEALRYLELARDYHEASKHRIYLGTVENNLAQLYKMSGKFDRAHKSIDSAIDAFKKAGDKTREGFAYDTKASICLEEGEPHDALGAITLAVKRLRRCENAEYLIETLQTKFQVELVLGDTSAAVETLMRAMEAARNRIGDERAGEVFEEFRIAANKLAESRRPAGAPPEPRPTVADGLRLVLPNSLAKFKDYQGIWINNSHLEKVGLRKGSLAVIVSEKVVRGDLIALTEIETGAVSCGFYDSDFGIVCLEGVNAEPQLFDANDIRILGKIVGVCRRGPEADGTMIVDALAT